MMKRIFSVLAMLYVMVLHSQTPYYLHFNEDNGLPSDYVYNVFQDKKGFIWIASNAGLSKYDGFEFITYPTRSSKSLPGSAIKEDSKGRIWYQNFDGYLFYLKHDTLVEFNQNTPQGFYPFHIAKDNIYVVSKKSIDIYSIDNLHLKKSISVDYKILKSTCGVNDEYHVLTESRLITIQGENIKRELNIYDYLPESDIKQLYAFKSSLFLVDKYNESKKLYKLDHEKFEVVQALNDEVFIQGLAFFENQLWTLTNNGIFTYHDKVKKNQIFPLVNIACAIKDKHNSFWIGSNTNGLYLIHDLNNTSTKTGYSNLANIEKVKNGMVLGSKQGEVVEYNMNTHSFERKYKSDYSSPFSFMKATKGNELLLINKQLSILDGESYKRFVDYKTGIKDVVDLDQKYFAFAGSDVSGLMIKKGKEHLPSEWDQIYKRGVSTVHKGVRNLFVNIRSKSIAYLKSKECLVFANSDGLFGMNHDSIFEIKIGNKTFSANKVFAYDNKLVLISSSHQLSIVDFRKSVFEAPTLVLDSRTKVEKVKICDSILYFIENEKVKYIDISKHNPPIESLNHSFLTHKIDDYILMDSILYVLSNDELVQINVEKSNVKDHDEVFVFNWISAHGKKYDADQLHVFKYDENYIQINYSLLNYKISETPVYYSINNSEWVKNHSNKRDVIFASLDDGFYDIRFRVGEHSKVYAITFEIKPPFWKNKMLITGVLSALICLLFLYLKSRFDLLKRQNEILKEKVMLETSLSKSILSSIKSQMNPHFFYNALNTIQAYIFSNDKANAAKYLNKFSKLTRMILEMSEEEKISIQREIDSLNLYLELEKMRFADDFEYSISVDSGIDQDFLFIPSMLIQPYVENAIKHGLLHKSDQKILTINFSYSHNILVVKIDDNGVGRLKSQNMKKFEEKNHKSFSMSANARRLAILNINNSHYVGVEIIDKYNAYHLPIGTTVNISIDMNDNNNNKS